MPLRTRLRLATTTLCLAPILSAVAIAAYAHTPSGLLLAGVALAGLLPAVYLARYLVSPALRLVEALRRLPDRGPLGLGLDGEFGEAEAAIDALTARLAQERQGRARFLGAVAQELRTPIATLKLQCALAAPERHPDEQRLARVVRVMAGQVERLTTHLDELVDASRLESGDLELEPRELDPVALAREVTDRFRAAAPGHTLAVEGPSGLVVRADPARLHQVLTQLVSNAVKYSPAGGRVRVVLAREAEHAVLAVHDEGVGVPHAELSRLFEPFHAGASSRRRPSDRGLGLSVTRRIVEGHGGWMTVESAPGRGSTFRAYLPLRAAPGVAARVLDPCLLPVVVH